MNRDEKTNPAGAQMQEGLAEPAVTQKQSMPKMPESLARQEMVQ